MHDDPKTLQAPGGVWMPEPLQPLVPSPEALGAVEQAVGYAFGCRIPLGAALIHRSAASEAGVPGWAESQRLEFLGDAVLGLLSADWLMRHSLPDLREGAMTKIRSRLTNTDEFAAIARRAGLDRAVVLGIGEDRGGGRERAALLADTLEAVFGAIWIDGGWPAVAQAFDHLFDEERALALQAGTEVNPKGVLQELVQRRWGTVPAYAVADMEGPPHARRFVVMARIAIADGTGKVRHLSAHGEGPTKQAAEVAAAEALLRDLQP